MLDFERIAEISFLVMELDQTLVFESGMIVDRDNLAEYIRNTYDA